jgi:quinone-modifying oxidoreductase subunit QmoB
MDTKIGVYICKGCDIAKSLDLDKLSEVATGETEASVCKAHDILCSRDGVDLIKTDIGGERLNRVVVAACSQRVFPELFDFGGDVLTDRVNLREHVAWSHTPNDEDTQMLAEDHIRMGISRVATVEPPEALLEETNKDLMVIGGGITGMTAAKSASAYKDLEDSGVAKLAEEIEADPNITVHKSTTVKKTSGAPGHPASLP